MTTKVFKIGERVSVETYAGACWFPNEGRLTNVTVVMRRGIIVAEKDGGFLVKPDDPSRDSEYIVATPRMLRRLKPKKRREWVIQNVQYGFCHFISATGEPKLKDGEKIIVREVRNDSHRSQKAKE